MNPSRDPMRVTIAHTFYNQHKMLSMHLSAWARHPPGAAEYCLIDDGSPHPIGHAITMPGLSVFRIEPDIPWNIAGARNLAVHCTNTPWVLCADIDHIVTADSLKKILELDLKDPDRVYALGRRRARDGFVGCRAIINFLINRQRYLDIGGHDEDFSGHYGGEETFFRNCLRWHRLKIIYCDDILLDWHPRTGGTFGLARDRSVNSRLFAQKLKLLKSNRYLPGKMLRFKWRPAVQTHDPPSN